MLLLGFSRFRGKNKGIKCSRPKSSAFTLAEVLITLGIIGVVAAMTLPVLNAKIEDKALISQKKKAYSEFMQAFNSAKFNGEFVYNTSIETNIENFRILQSKFKVLKSCNVARDEGCWTDTCDQSKIKDNSNSKESSCYDISLFEISTGARQAGSAGFVDTSGRQWALYKKSPSLWIFVDVNGDKKPNLMDKDRFMLEISSDRKSSTISEGFPSYVHHISARGMDFLLK